MGKTILFNDEAKKKILEGVRVMARVVGSTHGAAGQPVVITNAYGSVPIVTKDGVTVAKYTLLEDDIENIGCMFLKNAAHKTVTDAGDGTTSTIVIAHSLIEEGVKQLSAGAKSQDIKSGIEKACIAVVKDIQSKSEEIGDDNSKILNIATISANNDTAIGGLIADVYTKIGKKGLLHLAMSENSNTYTKLVDGFEMKRGWVHAGYATNVKGQAVYENPKILVADYSVKHINEIGLLLSQLAEKGIPLIIISSDIEGEIFGTLIVNKNKNGLKVCVVKAPVRYKREALEDIAKMTGATLICDEIGLKLESATMEHLGSCDSIVISETNTVVINGHGNPETVSQHKEYVKNLAEQTKDLELKAIREERLANLSGSVATIYVGGTTDVEAQEKYDRVDDACRSVRSAIEEGVSVGGGISLLRSASVLDSLVAISDDEKTGINIVKKALESPLRQMVRNAGDDESYIIRKVQELEGDMGYNIKTSQYEDLKLSGVVDATKVIRVSLQNAVSVANSILSSDALMVEVRTEK